MLKLFSNLKLFKIVFLKEHKEQKFAPSSSE